MAIVLYATLAAMASATTGGKTEQHVQNKLTHIRDFLAGDTCATVKIVRLSDETSTRFAQYPEALLKSADYVVVVRRGGGKMVEAVLDGVSAAATSREGDLRWGVLCLGRNDKTVGAFFVDTLGHLGYLDKQPVTFDINIAARLLAVIKSLH